MNCCAGDSNQDAEYIDAVQIPNDRSFDDRLDIALNADLFFRGVDLERFNPDEHVNKMKPVTEENLRRIANVLKENPDKCIKITGYCGPPVHMVALKLSLQRTRLARTFLQDLGVMNKIAAYPMGFVKDDDKGPRCETSQCTAEDVERLEAEAELMFITGLPITFFDPASPEETHRCVFTKSPLGMKFRAVAPIVITLTEKGNQAEAMGVKLGWKIKEINDRDVLSHTYEEAYHRIAVGSKTLKMNQDQLKQQEQQQQQQPQ